MRALGPDLRAVRRSRGLTLTQLAQRLDRSVGWMSQVERGLSVPDHGTLRRLAAALDAPLSLIADRGSDEVVRADRRRGLGERVPGLSESLLSPDLTDGFEVIHSVFRPGAERLDPVIRDTTEIAHLLSGRLSVWSGDTRHDLEPGDTIRLRGQPFRWANPHEDPAVAIWIISPAIYTQNGAGSDTRTGDHRTGGNAT